MQDPTLARPYAVAAFEYAGEHQAYAAWSLALLVLAEIVHALKYLLNDPRYTPATLADLCIQFGSEYFTAPHHNFIRLLARAHRLDCASLIVNLYESLVAAVNKTIDVQVQSVVPLTPAYQEQLKIVLKKRFSRDPVLTCDLNQDLIAGLVIRVGDEVIDASMKGQFLKLRESICN